MGDADRIVRLSAPEPMSGCWLWTGACHKNGYGSFKPSGQRRNVLAHRKSFELFKGTVPQGMQVLHRCDVRCCVNPEHLFVGTPMDNMVDKINKGRAKSRPIIVRPNCRNGHELNERNLKVLPNGSRTCTECNRIAALKCWRKKRFAQ